MGTILTVLNTKKEMPKLLEEIFFEIAYDYTKVLLHKERFLRFELT